MLTARISPNNKPIISKRIYDKKPITTNPIARDEWANKPNKASLGSLVVFCNLNKINATADEINNTEKDMLISKN